MYERSSVICIRGLFVQQMLAEDTRERDKLMLRAHFGPTMVLHVDLRDQCRHLYGALLPHALNARKLTDHFDLTDKMLGKGKFGKVFNAVCR